MDLSHTSHTSHPSPTRSHPPRSAHLSRRAVLAGALAAAPAVLVAAPDATAAPGHRRPRPHGTGWVHTWTAMPQLTEVSNMPPPPFTQTSGVFADATVRQTVHVSLGGPRLRLHLCNVFGGTELPVTSVSVALPAGGAAGTDGIVPGSARQVTFGGAAGVTVPVGQEAVSDPVEFEVATGTNLTVTLYLAQGQASQDITSHPGSRTTTYMVAGDHSADTSLPGAATVEHWYFISGIEVPDDGRMSASVIIGDSLTDGRGSTSNANDRWPDQLQTRLFADPATAEVAVLNQAAGGNAVVSGGLGPTALSRFDRDALGPSGVTSVVIFEGVNDIGVATGGQAGADAVARSLIAAYQEMIGKAHAHGLKVYGATITPFGGNTYDDADGTHEAARQTVNAWIRGAGHFDACVDLDAAVRDPGTPRRLAPAYDVGDHLHLNPTGYGVMAAAFPLELFRRAGARRG